MKVTDETVNKKIAEFMGFELHDDYIFKEVDLGIIQDLLYTDSLDALVPVWEKLPQMQKTFEGSRFDLIKLSYAGFFTSTAKSIQQAAAHATYKAILELEK